jgi:hypothetical protein
MNGVIYAGFGSFCDFSASHSRGRMLGWNAANRTRLAHAKLNDPQATSPTSFFLSSVWMSGFGLADADNRVIFPLVTRIATSTSRPKLVRLIRLTTV